MLFFVFVFFFLVVMPLVLGSLAVVTEHRRKMAELQLQARPIEFERIAALESRLATLTEIVHEQTIALDSLTRAERIDQRVSV